MEFKLYRNKKDRSKKLQKDLYKVIQLNQLEPNTKRLFELEQMYVEWKNTNKANAKMAYGSAKGNLQCVNVHNRGDFLKDEFISTNFLCYDIDGIDKKEVTTLINYSKKLCQYSMVSPSGHGVKLFFHFKSGGVTKRNFKILYRNFATQLVLKIKKDLGLNITIDMSSNDLNRLCYIGKINVNELEAGRFNASDFYDESELKSVRVTKIKSTYSSNNTIVKIESIISELENDNIKVVKTREDLMNYGFQFASLTKEGVELTIVYSLYKRLVKIGEDQTDTWITKSGTDNVYNLQTNFKEFVSTHQNNKQTIGSFFYRMKQEFGMTGIKYTSTPI